MAVKVDPKDARGARLSLQEWSLIWKQMTSEQRKQCRDYARRNSVTAGTIWRWSQSRKKPGPVPNVNPKDARDAHMTISEWTDLWRGLTATQRKAFQREARAMGASLGHWFWIMSEVKRS